MRRVPYQFQIAPVYPRCHDDFRICCLDKGDTLISTLSILVTALGAGLAVWGVINLLEGYGNDNPGAKSQGIKQLMAGGGVVLIGLNLVPMLANLFS